MPMHRAAYHHTPSNYPHWPYTKADHYRANTHAEDEILDYDLEYDLDDYLVPLTPYEQSRIFSYRVLQAAINVSDLHHRVCNILHDSIARLNKVCDFVDAARISSALLLPDVQLRTRVLDQLLRIKFDSYRTPRNTLKSLCHYYRVLVRFTSGEMRQRYSPVLFEVKKKRLIRDYIGWQAMQSMVILHQEVMEAGLEGIPGLDAELVLKTIDDMNNDMYRIWGFYCFSIYIFDVFASLEMGKEGLGYVAASTYRVNDFYFSYLNNQFKEHRTWYGQKEPLFPLSTQYTATLTHSLLNIELQLRHRMRELSRIERKFQLYYRWHEQQAIMVGGLGLLDAHTESVRKDIIKFFKRKYRHTVKWTYRLFQWGYQPSKWYLRNFVQKLGLRTWRRSKRREFLDRLSGPLFIRKYYMDGEREDQAASKRRQRKEIVMRSELRRKRQSGLGQLRRLVTATLLSHEARTAESAPSGLVWLRSSPASERPTNSTQVGKFITSLGFFDTPVKQNVNTSPSHSTKVNSLMTKSGRQLVRWVGKEIRERKSRRLLPRQTNHNSPQLRALETRSGRQLVRRVSERDRRPKARRVQPRLKFDQTPQMRAPSTSFMSFDAAMREPTAEMLTSTDLGRQIDVNCDGRDHSHESIGQGYKSDGKAQLGHAQESCDQPSEESTQNPQKITDRSANELSISENNQGYDPENDFDTQSGMDEAEEGHAPLSYQIPPEVLHAARQAPPQTRASYWSQKLYRGPKDEELLIHYCSNLEVSERVAKRFLDEKVLGFDIEWKIFGLADSIKENASLIQIASENRIALFHIARFPAKTAEQLMPPTLKAILESPHILKVGVAVKGDCSRLEKYFPLHIRGVFELSRLHNLVEYYATEPSKVTNKLVKLAKQVHQHLLLPLYKGEPLADEPQKVNSVRESDWSRPLDHEQIHYAAADAYAGFRLFDVLESKRKKLNPIPPIPRVCDYDIKPTPRSAPKTNRARKTKAEAEKMVAQALSGLDANDVEEETYETASEELAEEDDPGYTNSESSAVSSDEAEQSDAEYVPKHQRGIKPERSAEAEARILPRRSAHRVGRIELSRVGNADPGYPQLPTLPSQKTNTFDDFDAFDPPRGAHLGRRLTRKAVRDGAALPVEMEESDEYTDSELEDALSAMDIDTVGPSTSTDSSSTNITATPIFTPLIQHDTSIHSPEYTLATTWSQSYLASTIPPPSSTSTSRIRATVPPLRAYHLWHHQRVPLDAIGAHLRDPPLAQSTVNSYIMQSITMEKLEYRDEDLVALMLMLPANLRVSRYGWLSRRLGILR